MYRLVFRHHHRVQLALTYRGLSEHEMSYRSTLTPRIKSVPVSHRTPRCITPSTMLCKLLSYRLCYHHDSSVGIATRYGLGGPGIESRWGARFSAPVQTGSGAHPDSCIMSTGSFPWGVKRPGRGVDHPPPI